jgi:putative chitinase
MDDVVAHPEKVAEYPLNQMASMWFWAGHKLNELADRDDGGKMGEEIVRQITKKVNGGQNGIAQRLFYYRRFKKEIGL